MADLHNAAWVTGVDLQGSINVLDPSNSYAWAIFVNIIDLILCGWFVEQVYSSTFKFRLL